MLQVGDKCQACQEGLLVRTELGIACDECPFEMEILEVVAEQEKAKLQAGDYTFKPKKVAIILDDPEGAEEFIRGLIIARQNNNSEYFVDLIDMVNEVMQPWRSAKLASELRARDRAVS
jgi:hypothetical protein